jgi:hypothetical protein
MLPPPRGTLNRKILFSDFLRLAPQFESRPRRPEHLVAQYQGLSNRSRLAPRARGRVNHQEARWHETKWSGLNSRSSGSTTSHRPSLAIGQRGWK